MLNTADLLINRNEPVIKQVEDQIDCLKYDALCIQLNYEKNTITKEEYAQTSTEIENEIHALQFTKQIFTNRVKELETRKHKVANIFIKRLITSDEMKSMTLELDAKIEELKGSKKKDKILQKD